MTIQRAKHYLEHPVFGDPICIQARNVLAMFEQLKRVALERQGYAINETAWAERDEQDIRQELDEFDEPWEDD